MFSRIEHDREQERDARCAAIDAAILVLLREEPRTAGYLGRRVFEGRSRGARAMGRLLALRRQGFVTGKVDGKKPGAAKWRVLDAGLAWLRETTTVPDPKAVPLLSRATRFEFCEGGLVVEPRADPLRSGSDLLIDGRLAPHVAAGPNWTISNHRAYLLGVDGQWKTRVQPIRVHRDEALQIAVRIEACWQKHRGKPADAVICEDNCPDCGLVGCVRGRT